MDIIKEIKSGLPKDAMISDVSYEGSEIILYTKNREFFKNNTKLIKKIVDKIKKRIEVRADPSIVKDEKKTKDFIKRVVPKDAEIKDVYFEPEFAKVVIHASKPGLVIGKNGKTMKSIANKTYWAPEIKRAPVIDSDVIKNIRKMLHKEAGHRKKFLNKLGEKIYSKKEPVDWIRLSTFGGCREVGRSSFLLQTPQSMLLMDCGISVKNEENPFPHLDLPEFNIQKLDGVVVTHSHMDHCLPPKTPVLMADGRTRHIDDVNEGDEVVSLNFTTGKWEPGKVIGKTSTKGHKKTTKIKTPYRNIKASPNHRFFTVRNMGLVETEAKDLKTGELLPSNVLQHPFEKKAEIILDTDVPYDPRRKDTFILPDKLTPKLASVLGYIQGDGHKRSDTSIRITDGDKQLLEKYKSTVKSLFNYTPLIRRHPDRTKEAWCLEINNAKIIRFIEKNFPTVLKSTKDITVPELVERAGIKVKAFYLRGLFDAESSVTLKPNRIKVTTYSETLLKQIRQMLDYLGIPTHINKKEYTINISSNYGIRRYKNLIGFESESKKKKLQKILNESGFDKEDLIPIKSSDLEKVIQEAGMYGRIHNSPKFRELLSIYDWSRRSDNSYCTRSLATRFAGVLEKRLGELECLGDKLDDKPKFVRQRLSLPISRVMDKTGLTRMQVEYRENGFRDGLWEIMREMLSHELTVTISQTQKNLEKINKILRLPVIWERIKNTTVETNPHAELIDIEVSPNRNFVASGLVVHNSGLIPYLYKYGYKGPVYCTAPTRDTMVMLQLDYLKICKREGYKAPYSSKDIENMVKHCVTLDYGEVSDIAPDMRLTLENAGHLLGSSSAHVHIGDGLHNVLYTGDLKYGKTRLFHPASTDFTRVETLLIESTYGDKVPPSHKQAEEKLVRLVKKTIKNGGKVLIPAFAVGRSQEVISILTDTNIDVPIYLDGMLWDATAIHTAYPEFMSKQMQKKILHKQKNPFVDPRLKGIGSTEERKNVLEESKPSIILSTSGMLTGGPVMEYLKEIALKKNNILIFVGYQGEGTLGRRIQKGWKRVPMEGNNGGLELKLQVETVEGLGGHSDKNQLVNFVKNLRTKPKRILIDHGETSSSIHLAKTLHKIIHTKTESPKNMETIRLR